jgi:Copper amine oxidase N-terminal domain/WXXGXW repeat (2 copies)
MVRQALIVAIGAFLLFSSAIAARADVGITINGSSVAVYPAPIMQNGRVFVPLRGVFENLGASVVYSNGRINATGNNTEISLTIGSTQATVNGSPVTIDVAPFIVGASTYVPLRFVSQALGAGVSWDNADQIVDITTGSVASSPDSAPPPIPYYEPPPVPEQNYIWMPGYWAWGIAGYYWVPGTWVVAPQYGLLWTPGYWSWQNGGYAWHQGYWASNVGFYGGVDYGGGYYGHGFVGGRWSNNVFRYNTAVLPVTNTTVIKNVYVDKTVVVNVTVNRVSYNGGPSGTSARPTASEIAVTHAKHVPMTPAQQQHVQVSAQDRTQLAKVNAGKPPVVTAPRPFTPAAKPAGFVPVTASDRVAPARTVAPRPVVPHTAAPRPAAPPPAAAPRPVTTRPMTTRPTTPRTAAPPPVVPRTAAPGPVPATPHVRRTPHPRPTPTPTPKP